MNGTFSKISTLFILIAVVLAFTGLSTYVSAAHSEKVEKSCCDECNKNDNQSTGHCSTPDCPMFLCLSVNVVSVFTLSELTGSVYDPHFPEELSRESQPKPIFHPPVIVWPYRNIFLRLSFPLVGNPSGLFGIIREMPDTFYFGAITAAAAAALFIVFIIATRIDESR